MEIPLPKKPWWRTDIYLGEHALPTEFDIHSGPQGVALVKVWPGGQTQMGWGLQGWKDPKTGKREPGFIDRYPKREFLAQRCLFGYDRDRWAFAVVMRSVQMICIDIDGKNGGIEHASRLGVLPATLAETSKSGDGYHLFYWVPDVWSPERGYGGWHDFIGIEQGVDIRAVGCVYHHKNQRWNSRSLAELPEHLKELLQARRQKQAAQHDRVATIVATGDPLEVLLMQDQLLVDLAKPIQLGKRNTTLFAIGQKMKTAGIVDWQDKLGKRAVEVGLDSDESDRLVRNVETYD